MLKVVPERHNAQVEREKKKKRAGKRREKNRLSVEKDKNREKEREGSCREIQKEVLGAKPKGKKAKGQLIKGTSQKFRTEAPKFRTGVGTDPRCSKDNRAG